MRSNVKKILLLVTTGWAAFLLQGCGPSTFAECLEEAVKSAGGDVSSEAAKMIQYSCRQQFASNSEKSTNISLDRSQLDKIKVTLTTSADGNSFDVEVYNGNAGIYLTDIVLDLYNAERKAFPVSVRALYGAMYVAPYGRDSYMRLRFPSPVRNSTGWLLKSATGGISGR